MAVRPSTAGEGAAGDLPDASLDVLETALCPDAGG
jgi:hypothetical protein